MLTPPLEAGTKLWGFQRGRASPLVKGGVKSPPAKWLRLIVRLGNPKARMEAITSRTFLLSAVARQSTHAGTRHLTITSQHAETDKAKVLLTAIHALIGQFKSAAEQFKV